jgi:hypothetical protein
MECRRGMYIYMLSALGAPPPVVSRRREDVHHHGVCNGGGRMLNPRRRSSCGSDKERSQDQKVKRKNGKCCYSEIQRDVEWILERVREGGSLVMVAVWVDASRESCAAKLYVALAFRHEVVPIPSLTSTPFTTAWHGLS